MMFGDFNTAPLTNDSTLCNPFWAQEILVGGIRCVVGGHCLPYYLVSEWEGGGVSMSSCVRHTPLIEVRGQLMGARWISPSTVWTQGIELGLSGLPTGSLHVELSL